MKAVAKIALSVAVVLAWILFAGFGGGGEGVELESRHATTTNEAEEELGPQSSLLWIKNDTYTAPEQLVGTLFGFGRRTGDESYDGVPTHDFEPERIPGRIIGWESTKTAEPRLRSSMMINREVAASTDILSYLSASLTTERMVSIIVTDLGVVRARDDLESYGNSLVEWITNNAGYLATYHQVIAIDGVVMRGVTGKFYSKLAGEAKAGHFGVNVEGSYYSSSEEYFVDYIFGLDFTDISLAAAALRANTMTMALAPTIQVMIDDASLFSEETKEGIRSSLAPQ